MLSWFLWIFSGLIVTLAIVVMLLAGYAERRLGIERIPKAQWSQYVDQYLSTYQLRSIVKVGKYSSTTYAFRDQEPPFSNLDVIRISANVTESETLMFAPKGPEIEMQKTVFEYQGKKYPARLYTWLNRSLTEQQPMLVIAAVDIKGQRYYLKSFRTRETQEYSQEFGRFLQGLRLK